MDGWMAAQANGLYPVTGYPEIELTLGRGLVHYGYYIPNEFKIIVMQESGEITVSEVIERKAFNSQIRFDVKSGIAKERSVVDQTLSMFIRTFIITVLIEGIVLWLFGFRSKHNMKILLKVNAYTQMGLTLVIAYSMYLMGILLALLAFAICEIVIFIVEARMFSKQLEGHTRRRRIVFALCANTASLLLGTFIAAALMIQ